jgi:glycine/D-amino acid oxidase-like deaminating enzyme
MQSLNIIVLGGGISGLTTAIVLQSLGYTCTIIAEQAPGYQSNQQASSLVPTYYAMASAYPHNLQVENLLRISEISQSIFNYFFEQKNAGIKNYRMFEIFESEPGKPSLASERMQFQSTFSR